MRLRPGEMSDRAAQRSGSAADGLARLAGCGTAIFERLPSGGATPARPLEPVFGSRLADSSGPVTVANEHGNRADRANDERRRAEHRDDYAQGIDDGALR